MEAFSNAMKTFWFKLQTRFWRFGFLTHTVNANALATALDVESKGRLDGKRGLPNPLEINTVGTEAEIVHFCNELLRSARSRVEAKHARTLRLARKIDVTRDVASLATATQKAESRALELSAADQMRIAQALEIGAEREDEYNAFQKKHELERGAHLPRFRGLYLGFLVVLAGLLTLAFAGWMSDSYAIAALWSALPWAVACTLLPSLVGALGIRYLNHLNGFLALAGLVIALVSITTLGFFALGFESALTGAISLNNWPTVLQTWLNSPVELLQTTNWAIAGPIFAAGMAALTTGYALDDPYPRFGTVRRNMEHAREFYVAKLAALQHKTARVFEQQHKVLNRRHNATKRDYQRFLTALNKYEQASRECDDYQTAVGNVGGLLLSRYRQANISTNSEATRVPVVVYAPPFESTRNMTSPSERTLFDDLHRGIDSCNKTFLGAQQRLDGMAATYVAAAEEPIVVQESASQRAPQQAPRKRLSGFMPNRAGAA